MDVHDLEPIGASLGIPCEARAVGWREVAPSCGDVIDRRSRSAERRPWTRAMSR